MSKKLADWRYTDTKGHDRLRKIKWWVPPGASKRMSMLSWHPRRETWTIGVNDYQWEFSLKAMYRLTELRRALKSGEPVWLVEGEKDADSVAAFGVCATTPWQGASQFEPAQARWFVRSASPIVLCLDNDLPGAYAGWLRYRTLIAGGVASERISVVAPPPRLRAGSDVTDAIEAGLGLSDLRPVGLDAIQAAAERYGAARAARYCHRERRGA